MVGARVVAAGALPPVEEKATECPSISTLMMLLSEYSPPEMPRTARLGEMWSSTT